MKSFLIAVAFLVIGFGGGVAFQQWRGNLFHRYQIVSGGNGNAFRQDTQTGDTWLITSKGEESLVLPPDAQIPLDTAKKLYDSLKDTKVFDPSSRTSENNPPETLRDWAIQMNRATAKDGRASSGIYDAAAQRSAK